MKVADLMTTAVFTLRLDKKLFIAEQIMGWAHIRHVPVVDSRNRVVGMISHRDILRASIASVSSKVAKLERRQHLSGIDVREIMQTQVRTIGPDASVQEAASLMRGGKFGCLPVVNQKQELLGIITEHDLLRLVERLPVNASLGGIRTPKKALKRPGAAH